MASISAHVALEPLGNCLVNLPSSFILPLVDSANLLVQQVVVSLVSAQDGRALAVMGWTGFTCKKSSTVEIDANYAHVLGLSEGTKVIASIDFKAVEMARAFAVELEPLSSNDWELTELYAESIEDKFLSQVRCVSAGQKLVIRPATSSNNQIVFVVKSINGGNEKFKPIGNQTELHIIPKIHNQPKLQHPQSAPPQSKKSSRRSTLTAADRLEMICRTTIDPSMGGLAVKISQRKELVGIHFVHVQLIQGPGTPRRALKVSEKEKEMGLEPESFGMGLVATLKQTTDFDDDDELAACTISSLLAISLGIENTQGELIRLQSSSKMNIALDISNCQLSVVSFVTDSSFKLSEDGVLPLSNGDKSHVIEERKILSMEFGNYLNTLDDGIPLTNFMKLPIIEGVLPFGGQLFINARSKANLKHFNPWVQINGKMPPITFKGDVLIPVSRLQEVNVDGVQPIVGFDSVFDSLSKHMRYFIPTYVFGKPGSGKTLFSLNIQSTFKGLGYYVKLIDFEKDLVHDEDSKSKDRNQMITQVLESTFQAAAWHAPSIVILENIDKVIPKKMEQGDSGSSDRLAEFMINRIQTLLKPKKVGLLLTGKSRDSVNQLIFQKHVTEEDINLLAPSKIQRAAILNHMIKTKFTAFSGEDCSFIDEIAHETEGYYPADFNNLIDRAYHDLLSNRDSTFTMKHFSRAIDGYVPTSLRGVKLQKSTGVKWSDIGGLKEAKDVLIETLEWPTKYSPIFANCPIRLRSGILLYGYPGCGKTMLASAIGSRMGLNFISVKGPEILNKYIGASEQAIRGLFDRAQSAKPCVLFFDEFDSIAPKRGHDSTGVTDRIVNQLLTQMDGAEGLEGVYVIGATSRPDLIDSALLRPGRLDKSVICDLPDFDDRLDILNTVVAGNGFTLAEDVDLDAIAKATEGFTGADLQAVAYNGYLKRVHEVLDDQISQAQLGKGDDDSVQVKVLPVGGELVSTGLVKRQEMAAVKKITNVMKSISVEETPEITSLAPSGAPQVAIKQAHLLASLEETNPSISRKELAKFQRIYGEFQESKRPGDMKTSEGNSGDVGIRSSLM